MAIFFRTKFVELIPYTLMCFFVDTGSDSDQAPFGKKSSHDWLLTQPHDAMYLRLHERSIFHFGYWKWVIPANFAYTYSKVN